MSLQVRCARCGDERDEPGALLFSTPRQRHRSAATVAKYQLCGECYRDLIGFIRRGRPVPNPGVEEKPQ